MPAALLCAHLTDQELMLRTQARAGARHTLPNPAHGGQGLLPRPLHEPVSKWRSVRRRSSQSNAKLTRGVPGAVATGWLGAAALGGP
jgi:hypothetical protein